MKYLGEPRQDISAIKLSKPNSCYSFWNLLMKQIWIGRRTGPYCCSAGLLVLGQHVSSPTSGKAKKHFWNQDRKYTPTLNPLLSGEVMGGEDASCHSLRSKSHLSIVS